MLVGNFPPSRFTIDVLRDAKALGPQDLNSASYLSLLPDQLTEIKFSSWGRLLVVNESLTVDISEAPYIRATDFILKCLREIAAVSSVKMMGINVKCTYLFPVPSERDRVGVRLAPPLNWGDWGRKVSESISLPITDARHGGLISATMRQANPDARDSGHIDVRVDGIASNDSGAAPLGVQISVNDHYELKSDSEMTDRVRTVKLLDILESHFDGSISNSMKICQNVISGN